MHLYPFLRLYLCELSTFVYLRRKTHHIFFCCKYLEQEELFRVHYSFSHGDDHIGFMGEGQLVDHTGSQGVSKRYPGCPYECLPHCVCPLKIELQRVVGKTQSHGKPADSACSSDGD